MGLSREISLVVILLLLAQSVAAASVVDQSYDPGSGGGYFVNSTGTYAQLFQAGLSGPVAGIDVRAYNYFGGAVAPLQLGLWTVATPYPEALTTNLASASINNALIPSTSGFVYFDLSSSGATFTAGQTYAIVLSTTSNFSYIWEGPSNGTYANGSGRIVSGSNVYYTLAGQDLDFGFKTYISEVPEPATLALTAIGAICIRGIRQRRR